LAADSLTELWVKSIEPSAEPARLPF